MSFSGSISRNDKGQRDMSDKGLNWPGWSEEIFQTNICEKSPIPAGIYLFKINNRNTRTICEIYSMLTIKTPKRRQWRRSGLFIVNSLNRFHIFFLCSHCWFWTNAGCVKVIFLAYSNKTVTFFLLFESLFIYHTS